MDNLNLGSWKFQNIRRQRGRGRFRKGGDGGDGGDGGKGEGEGRGRGREGVHTGNSAKLIFASLIKELPFFPWVIWG